VKFHAVFWPIMLKAMGLPLPKQILVHGWWQKDGAKISKSTGNIIDPIAVIDEWGLDAFRFYVLRELDIGPDGNWTDAGFKSRYQAELANGLGNLVNRSLSMLKRYRDFRGRDARMAQTKPASGRAAKPLGTRHARQSIRGPDRAVQARQGPGAGHAARRSALQSDGNLPGAGGSALAIPARHGGENLRATRFDRRSG
jgi:methionyl-tRNA synthetase